MKVGSDSKQKDNKIIRLSIDNQTFHLNQYEAASLRSELRQVRASAKNNDSVISEPNINKNIGFDERALFNGLTTIPNIGDRTAMRIIETLLSYGFMGVSIDELEQVDNLGNKTAELAWIYLNGFYEGTIEG